MVMKKIKLTESDLYRIIKQVLLEQEEEKRSITFSPGSFESLITSSSGEGFIRTLNNNYDEIIVNGELDLNGTQIQSLPDNLHVEGGLYLDGTPIQSLPDNLYVKGNLGLYGTQIQSLPDNLRVTDTIYIYGTPLSDNDKLVAKYREKYTIDRT